jgi:hypothetical protein
VVRRRIRTHDEAQSPMVSSLFLLDLLRDAVTDVALARVLDSACARRRLNLMEHNSERRSMSVDGSIGTPKDATTSG